MSVKIERWELSAPASQVLLTGAATPPTWAIQLALKELVLRRALRLGSERQRRMLVFHQRIDTLTLERWPNLPGSERSLLGVMEAFPKAAIFRSDAGGVPIGVVAREVQRWYRLGGGYVQAEVLPELQRWGYYRIVELQNGPEWQLTETGVQKLAELHALLETGKTEFPGWLRQDRGKAAAYLTGVGATLLLLGNPVIWLWELLAEVLAGGTLAAEEIPDVTGSPFVVPPPQQDRLDRESRGEVWFDTDEREGGSESPGSAIESASDSGGGGGGFDSPGETIDAGFGGDGDGDGNGDGE